MTGPRTAPPDQDPDEPDEPDELLASRLGELLDGDNDLGGRTTESVDRRLRARSAASLGAELLAVGWWTATALLDTPGTGAATDAPTAAPTHRGLTAPQVGADEERGGS